MSLPHASPTDDVPPGAAYFNSYIGMKAVAAAERGQADGWLVEVIAPGDLFDLADNPNRLTVGTDEAGIVTQASRG